MGVRFKEKIKKLAGKCNLCNEPDYHVLDVHRWQLPGAKGGEYISSNTIILCACCHRRVEFGEIEIVGRHFTSSGKYVFQIKRNGKEEWIYQSTIIDSAQDFPCD